jgi:hypothetical protein
VSALLFDLAAFHATAAAWSLAAGQLHLAASNIGQAMTYLQARAEDRGG